MEHLDIDCAIITHHTSTANLSGPDFLRRKPAILATIDHILKHGDLDRMATIRNNKHTL